MKKVFLIYLILLFNIKLAYSKNLVLSEDQLDTIQGFYYSVINCPNVNACLTDTKKGLEFSNKLNLDKIKNEGNDWHFFFKNAYARALYDTGNFSASVDQYEEIIASKRFTNEQKSEPLINIGWFYYKNENFYDPEKAANYTERGIDYTKDIYAISIGLNNLGVMYHEGKYKKDLKKALSLYRQSAKYGADYAYGNLALFYVLGEGGVKQNYSRAVYNFKLATIADYSENDNFELKIILKKKKLPKNKEELKAWYIEDIKITKEFSQLMKINYLYDIDEEEKLLWLYLINKYSEDTVQKNYASADLGILLKSNFKNIKMEEISKKSDLLFKKYFE